METPTYAIVGAGFSGMAAAIQMLRRQSRKQAPSDVRYVGPLLRSQFWEATAVPELRLHAQQLVDGLLA